MNGIQLTGYFPGSLGRIVELHGTYYAEYWDLGLYFEAKVAVELANFLSRFDPARDGAWFAANDGVVVGAIFIDGKDAAGEGARLRWFILDPTYQGQGIGQRLMDAALNFCRQQRFLRVYLTTFSGLIAARHLYEKAGFRLCHEEDGTHLTGNAALVEQVFEWLPPAD
ncbi:MAG: GNAT family N-acetyltransferase [Anaerolineae bacterium]|nr:GNAT family N-acetyltransferase [Anaerolineae bacterium]